MRNLAIVVAGTLCLKLFVFGTQSSAQERDESMKLIEVRKIWDKAPHNAFTDLVRFRDRWFCVFREGERHPPSPDGALRVISSADGMQWESEVLIRFTPKGFSDLKPKVLPTGSDMDLRGAKICITPDGRLMLHSALVYNEGHDLQTLAWFSKDGKTWGQAVLIGEHQYWLWRVTWHRGIAYGTGRIRDQRVPRLYKSTDGSHFEVIVKDKDFFPHVPGAGEGTLRFLADDTAFCLLRPAHLGLARPPYTRWEWKELGASFGGPNMIQLPDSRFVAVVRLSDPDYENKARPGSWKHRTALCWLDPKAGTLTEFLALPSGGDTSYAGLVLHDGLLWISYYSSHEGKTSIYLAKVKIDK